MVKQKWSRFFLIILVLIGILLAGFLAYNIGRPLQIPNKESLFEGVDYTLNVRLSPRLMMIRTITIDTHQNGIRYLVTPPDEKGSQYPVRARTTSQFLREYGVQVAINGDGFSP